MEIKITCPCGGVFEARDRSGTYINPRGKPDDEGRILRIEVAKDEWLSRHSTCPAFRGRKP